MQRMVKWMAPVVAMGLLLGYSATKAVAADDEKGTVSGTVTGVDGKPAADVTVKLMKPVSKADKKAAGDTTTEKPKHAAPVATATTDKDGKFEMKDVPVGSYNCNVNIKGVGMGHDKVTVTSGATATADITIKAASETKKHEEKKDNTK
jgi:5-hydroxyisourate hydrolase-like protein (transthyretin family)